MLFIGKGKLITKAYILILYIEKLGFLSDKVVSASNIQT
jgi:hypothetical protein